MSPSRFQAFPLLALLLAAATGVAAKGAPDPKATALIQQLELEASPIASRDLPGWKAPRRIVVAAGDDAQLEALRAMLPGVEILAAAEGEALDAQLATAQVAVGLCNEQTLAAGKQLHWIQALQVGVERCVAVPGFAQRGIVLTNMQRTSGPPIAEHAIAMLLALTRGLPHYARQQQTGTWTREEAPGLPMREVGGRTLLVVGLGGIGTEVARRAHGLGMRVIATRNSSREGPDYVARVGLSDELLALAAEADVVVNAVPLTPATRNLFDRRFFDTLKPDAYFINVARGGSVVTADLVAALKSGRLAGAGLDVTEPEPLPADHELWKLPNVVVTPHIAAASDTQDPRYWILVQENLRRYAAGEPLLNVVDVARGY
jgi:phosphoglycerate dehydrogenase-like enzyme